MALPNRITEEQRRANSRIGGIKAQSLEQQAQRIVKNWPELKPDQKAKLQQLLRPVIGNSR